MAMDMVMDIMDMESVKLRLSQRLMPMLSMALMEDMVLDTVLMVMEILATLLLVMAMDGHGYYGYGKREAEAEPKADANALYGTYGGYGLGHHAYGYGNLGYSSL